MKSDQDIDKALADEFAGYLKGISKEIVQPIRDEANKQKKEVDRLTVSIDQAGTKIAQLLVDHREQLSSEGRSLLTALDQICKQMERIVAGVSEANELTRGRLLEEAASISTAVSRGVSETGAGVRGMRDALNEALAQFRVQSEPWINQAGKSLTLAMESQVRSAEAKLLAAVENGLETKLRQMDAPLVRIRRLLYFLVTICLLQGGVIAALWFLR